MPRDNSEGKSSAELKEMLEQTEVEEAPVVEPEAEAVESEEEAVSEPGAKTAEPDKQETEAEAVEEEQPEKTYRIKVEGKEEDLPLEKLVEYAQKGRYLEREKARLKAEISKEQPKQATPQMPPEEMNKWFLEEANRNPLGAIMTVNQMIRQNEKEQEKAERLQERKFEIEVSETMGELWKHLKPKYQEFREYGIDQETALAKAEADFYREKAIEAMQRGVKKGAQKAAAKLKAAIPSGSKKLKPTTGSLPSPDEFKKLKSSDMAKYLRRVRNPGW